MAERLGCHGPTQEGAAPLPPVWQVKIVQGAHNHPPALDPQRFPQHRKLDQVQEELIYLMHAQGAKAVQITKKLHEGDTLKRKFHNYDIQNARHRVKRKLEGQGPLQAPMHHLLCWLEGENAQGLEYTINREESGHLSALWLSSVSSSELLRRYPSVLYMDCTYKTNVCRMPLFHIVGVTCIQQTFTARYCFLTGEQESDYEWALRRLRTCLNDHSPVTIITDSYNALLLSWLDNQHVIEFVKGALSDKESFVQVYIQRIMTFGTSGTSCVEGAHAVLKRLWLDQHKAGLAYCVKQMKDAFNDQMRKIDQAKHNERERIPAECMEGTAFAAVRGKISRIALIKTFQRWEEAYKKRPAARETCNCGYCCSWGMPCARRCRWIQDIGQDFQMTDFHTQWWFEDGPVVYGPLQPALLEPIVRPKFTSRRQAKSGRELSRWEQEVFVTARQAIGLPVDDTDAPTGSSPALLEPIVRPKFTSRRQAKSNRELSRWEQEVFVTARQAIGLPVDDADAPTGSSYGSRSRIKSTFCFAHQ
ncbi:PROTEIN FAR1-RELATED SEQUENCE 11-RELATED [Ceraceosorus bombacis]|uniref:PROTEIN FAR1-RELATED SEQUENCE 11-RELATED n=1 Tax=Ceraceosorus bombacis TaxID=401625 RepID=A0A0P1BQN3_9BASI|nr:PROTEIN FAR1-RELATED SEQUENCE 11-RELATED [Ceraceosorus bombacis]